MRKLKSLGIAVALLSGTTLNISAQKLGESPIEDVLNALSNSDKCHLVQGSGTLDTYVGSGHEVNGASGYTYAISKYGIPEVVLTDGPAGVRLSTLLGSDKKYATFCPSGTAMAATWNTSLVERMAQVIGNETFEYGCAVVLGPGVNIQRHPLCGRNFEYYSEDPLIAGKMGAAYVRGVQSQGVGCAVKHFAANNQETNRKNYDAQVSQRALREIYLKPFEIAVKEGQPWTVMSSYNKMNGMYTAENRELLTTLLRDEWGFGGVVMSDWINNADALKEIKAGNDLLMPGSTTDWYKLYFSASSIKNELNVSCRRILEFILRTPKFKGLTYSNMPDLESHAKVAREVAGEACVLLKNNDSTLPIQLEKTPKVALFGSLSYRMVPGGKGSGYVTCKQITSLPAAFTAAGFSVDSTLVEAYEAHIKEEGTDDASETIIGQMSEAKLPSELEWTAEEVEAFAQTSDFAVLTIGRSSKEDDDFDEDEYQLKPIELTMLTNVCQSFHAAGKRVIVVLNIPIPIEIV
ncbi:MAG: glycoside hydrolase family 3 C-terminal domain-containing protein, partial [Bacteroidaceae bacterium]|nr:glycoside hydrolase family 3 C-terminal domain-containing protein [Bacteroidaceae bacterium]